MSSRFFQGLCACAAVLLYVMTRDKMCSSLGEGGVTLLVRMLATPTFLGEELEGKQAKDWEKVKEQARSVRVGMILYQFMLCWDS